MLLTLAYLKSGSLLLNRYSFHFLDFQISGRTERINDTNKKKVFLIQSFKIEKLMKIPNTWSSLSRHL